MQAMKNEILLSRSKSTGFLDKIDNFKCFNSRFCGYNGSDNLHGSVSSIEGSLECDGAESEETKLDSGIGKSFADADMLVILDQKIDRLCELLQEQHNLVRSIRENVSNNSRCHRRIDANKISTEGGFKDDEKAISTNESTNHKVNDDGAGLADEADVVRSQYGGIEITQDVTLDHIIKVALENFLQSDEVRAHVSAATAECVRGAVQGALSRALSAAYLPLVQRSHRRLVHHVTKLLDDSFADLEGSTASLFKSIHKTSRNIRMSLEKHQSLLEATDPVKNLKLLRTTLKGVLEDELRTWRERVVQETSSQAAWDGSSGEEDPPYVDYAPSSPMQPANPETTAIDSLMKCALIHKHVREGDVNGAFETALGSSDLALVVAACRAADSAPAPARPLRPAVRLSLLQQLATDMVHDTQLKCKYLEEAILDLDKCEASTRAHLPLVVADVRAHLAAFLRAYPKHHACRRVALILMAADNLLK